MSNQFRIGGHYCREDGEIVCLTPIPFHPHERMWEDKYPGYHFVLAMDREQLGAGYICVETGKYVLDMDGAGHAQSLLPGELVNVNGEWVSPTPTLDKMEAEKRAAEAYFSFNVGDVIPAPASVDLDLTRPALDWNKPASTDRFPGFTVTKGETPQPTAQGLCSPDLGQSSHQVAAVFGSAKLI